MRLVLLLIAASVLLVPPLRAAESPLARASSAFVRAHADSPVKFEPWGEAAFARARAENKPLYVLVGAFTQELARAMREQSFAREENAAVLNDGFVCVVVDRDERPDLAAFLQNYVGIVKQMQGWPLNVWLTPELKPFEGATYLPPSDEWGKEGFPNAVRRFSTAWQTDPEAQRAKADEAVAVLAASGPAPGAVEARAVAALVAENLDGWMAVFDATQGGFGDPPRRLEPELMRFLVASERAEARDAALQTLKAMVASPVRDPLDGGFFRSAGDTAWQQPNLQKTFSDQARIALALRAAGEASFEPAAAGALGYALSLGGPARGFSAAEDGTPEAVLPTFFWTVEQLRAALGGEASDAVVNALGCSEAGNVPAEAYLGLDGTGRNLPRLESAASVSAEALARLRAARTARGAPPRDSLATSGAHGLALAAFASSGEPAFRGAASQLAEYILSALILPDGRLRATPTTDTTALARDYALVAAGLLAHSQAGGGETARKAALALLTTAEGLFWDQASGRYLASEATLAPGVWVRLPAPAPDPADGFGAEAAMLHVLCTHGLGTPAQKAALVAAIAAELRDAPTIARGDQLLALQAYLATNP